MILTKNKFFSFAGDEALAKKIEYNLENANARSRSEFIVQALEFYIAYLQTKEDGSTLFPVLDNALDGRMSVQQHQLSRILFKLAVEVAIMSHIVAGTNEVTDGQLASIRRLCVDEVKRLSGRYSMEDAVRFQN